MIVLDASSVLELLLNTDTGALVADRIRSPAESLHAPHLLSVEVTQVLRRYANAGAVDADVTAAAVTDLATMDLNHYGHEALLPRVWELRNSATAYDAVYLALAEVLDFATTSLVPKHCLTARRRRPLRCGRRSGAWTATGCGPARG